jgi:hypothetical protein
MNVNQFQKHVVISVRLHGNLVTKFLKFMGGKNTVIYDIGDDLFQKLRENISQQTIMRNLIMPLQIIFWFKVVNCFN